VIVAVAFYSVARGREAGPVHGVTATYTDMIVALDALVAAQLGEPDHLSVGVRAICDADVALLRDVELAHIHRAVPRRRSEYATGRALLRDLLHSEADIPVGPNGAPLLPPDARGSIAHDEHWVIGAVSTDRRVASIGLDMERDVELHHDLAPIIVRPDEGQIDPLVAFVLKEATYKAWSALGGSLLEHHDVRLSIQRPDAFDAEVIGSAALFRGRWLRAADRVFAIVVVRS
jgi:4'-phosphopantetheinyl transferase EntD